LAERGNEAEVVKSQREAPVRTALNWRVKIMDKLIVKALAFKADRDGVTALEYGIIASILGLVLVGIFQKFGTTLSTLFSSVSTSI
jgi:pilus assembly protein Flp/PilA